MTNIIKFLKRQKLSIVLLINETKKHLRRKEFVNAIQNRSASEKGGQYVALVKRATRNYNIFCNFKRHPSYREHLEHVTKDEGARYLEIIKVQCPIFLERIEVFKENDAIGNPLTHEYVGIGRISPTTLRYIKVSSDLCNLFGNNLGDRIAEIGVGYGGQLLINDRIFKMVEYQLYDLPPVLELVSQYLESFIINCFYKLKTLNTSSGDEEYDCVISNYAFSELPSKLQLMYIKKVISKARRGYLTMNSGLDGAALGGGHLSVDELRQLLPLFELLEDKSTTNPNNFIITWGGLT